jgi:hypothetical protein
MAAHKSRANWFERLREKRRQRKARAAASAHANREYEPASERARRESGASKGGFPGDGGFGGI